jgi:hypothetical protein
MAMKVKVVLVFIITIFIFTPTAYSWDNSVHEQMVKDAIALCPKELRLFLKQHINMVIYGSQEPIIALTSPTSYAYGYRNSYYIPDEEKGTAPNEVKVIALSVIDLLSKGSPEADLIARRMGLICSYASDSIQPKRYIGVAPNYPLDYLVEEKRLSIIYDGHSAVDDFSLDLKRLAKGVWDKDFSDEQYYNLAVNYIVDVWVTIWEKGGLPPGEMIVIGSQIRPIPKDVLEAKKQPIKPETLFDLEKLEEYNANVIRDKDIGKFDDEDGDDTEGAGEGGTTTPAVKPETESDAGEGDTDRIDTGGGEAGGGEGGGGEGDAGGGG